MLLVVLLAPVQPAGGEQAERPAVTAAAATALGWPAPAPESRPWTRWWWLGSAVDEAGITRELEQFRAAGIGGVEICPIYGVRGWEARDVPFLSPRWMELLGHTLREAQRLGLVVDLTTGTGWPFGGPWVGDADASSRVEIVARELVDGRLSEPLPGGSLQVAVAVGSDGRRVDLTGQLPRPKAGAGVSAQVGAPEPPPRGEERDASTLVAPRLEGRFRLYAAIAQGPIQKVKRAAPGGEGNVLDPFSTGALTRYLARFDEAFAGFAAGAPRAHFHDSFEYYGATYTPKLLDEFQKRRGYDLRGTIEALAGVGDADRAARVRADYRETLGELHLEYVRAWTAWAHARGSLSRNQAHGAPGDLVETYAAADVPETEVFKQVDEKQMPRLKLSSSAAHVSGGRLASAEAFTWLGEHFSTPLAEVKQAADWLLLSGVNHLLFHGIPYSPAAEPWPGLQFYASLNFGPAGGLWRELPALNAYLTRVQSVLQAGEPDEDVLLYYSPHDTWSEPLAKDARGDELAPQSPVPAAFEEIGGLLWRRGYLWDAVSEPKLELARVEDGRIVLGSGRYRALVLPRTRLATPRAVRRLAVLAGEGATIVLVGGPPRDVPGYGSLEARRHELEKALGELARHSRRVLAGEDVDALLSSAGVAREAMLDQGLQLVRRRHGGGRHYFVVNRSGRPFDGWVPLATQANAAALLDPLAPAGAGMAGLRRGASGGPELRLQLAPGESIVVRTLAEAGEGAPWSYAREAGAAVGLAGTWSVRFLEGGPELPAPYETAEPGSWTAKPEPELRRFAGTALYSLEFEHPGGAADEWRLDLGDVRESARVRLNGTLLGTLWCRPFGLRVGSALRPGRNRLELEITNLAANRVRDLDRSGVPWKRFHDINIVDIDYKPFDASTWPLRESGLLGPVTLTPLRTGRADQ